VVTVDIAQDLDCGSVHTGYRTLGANLCTTDGRFAAYVLLTVRDIPQRLIREQTVLQQIMRVDCSNRRCITAADELPSPALDIDNQDSRGASHSTSYAQT
jgi:hypothetical protein